MKVRKLAVFVVLLVLAAALMVACGGQEKSTSNTGSSTTASSNVASSTTASSTASTFDGLEEKEVRVATTEEDYQIFDGSYKTGLYASKNNMQRQISMGDKLYVATDSIISEYGYYEKDSLSNTIKNLYYPISGLSMLEGYGRLIGTYGDVPAIELNRQNDIITAGDNSNGNITAYKCKLIGCTIGWVDSENAIWNQNNLIPVGNPNDLQLTDISGQSRSNPMAWDFGEEVIAKCDGQSYQTYADSYVYSVSNDKIEIAGGDIKIDFRGRINTVFGYDFSKLESGLYYFQDLGVYKIV